MDKESFTKLIAEIFVYYRSEMPSLRQVDAWFFEVESIPDQAINFVKRIIYKEKDNLPRNIPKAIKEAYDNYPKIGGSVIKYDSIEDFRFPVGNLHYGLNILETKGYAVFFRYADSAGMPSNDRDRVVTKHKVMTGETKIDIGRIRNLIGANINKTNQKYISNRVALLQQQKEEILRQPGEDIDDDIPF